MKLYFTLALNDIQVFNEHYFSRNATFIQKYLTWILLAIFTVYIFTSLRDALTLELMNWGNWVIFLLAGVMLYWLSFKNKNLRKKAVVKLIKNNPHFVGEREVEFDADEVRYRTDKSETVYSYTSFSHYEDIADYYLLYLSKQNALIIPKRAFQAGQDKSDFEKLLQGKVSTDNIAGFQSQH